ncbi:DUF4422 domain-containing protein (plasmid) [Desulfobaculum bizertense]|nr:DUF4422 domain-containing protein [Desulfobaculum bizertense]UIJ39536.1 DUF4422 domain-containing protein [Desulfobaculum bizertense]
MSQRSGHRFNIFIMKKEYIKEYCSWLFDILKKLEPVISMEGYTDYDKRVFGFLAERMLDIWIYTKEINFTELPIVNLESQHWCKKIASFLKRKLKGSLRDCHVI